MKILIGTPCYGGLVTDGYTVSLIGTVNGLQQDQINYSLYLLGGDALINRARNKIAKYALDHDFDKLVFIDADITWEYTDLRRIITSSKLIVGGTYPLKEVNQPEQPILNFNCLPEHIVCFSVRKTKAQWDEFKKLAEPSGEIKVKQLPTGFLCIDRKVLELLVNKQKVLKYGLPNYLTGGVDQFFDFFPIRVHDGILESEDWAFCTICGESGLDIWLNTRALVNHTGSYTWKVDTWK